MNESNFISSIERARSDLQTDAQISVALSQATWMWNLSDWINVSLGHWSALAVAPVVAAAAGQPWSVPYSVLCFESSSTADGRTTKTEDTSENSGLCLRDPATLLLTDLTADGRPSLWCHLHRGDRLATRCTPVTLNLHLRRWECKRNKHWSEHLVWIIVFVLTYRVDLHVGSDTAVWEDLRELRDDAEGVRLWLKRSRTSFRLEVLSWDSEPESWDCCDGMRACELQYNTDSPQLPGTASPSLPSSQVGILLYRAPCVAPLSPQHSCRAKTELVTHPLYMMDYYGLCASEESVKS